MNRHLVSLSLVAILCIAMSARGVETKDMLLMGLVSNHNLVFGKENLFSGPLDTLEWCRYLYEVEDFVADNARDDEMLLSALATVFINSDKMITAIQVGYNSFFAVHGSYQDAVVISTLDSLEEIVEDLAYLQTSITEPLFFFSSKMEVVELLVKIAFFLEVTAQKAAKDFRKLLPELDIASAEFNEYL